MSTSSAGADFKIAGDLIQGNTTANSLNAQAEMMDRNADAAIQAGEVNAQKQMITAQAKMGQTIAGYGASGVTSTSGTLLEVLKASSQNANLDVMNIKHGAEVRAANYRHQAALNRFGAKTALTGSYFKAMGDAFGADWSSNSPKASNVAGSEGGQQGEWGADSLETTGGDEMAGGAGDTNGMGAAEGGEAMAMA